MGQTPREPATVRFGDFEFDRRTLELRRGAERVRLPPKPTVALALLVENAGSLVTREELKEAVWPETVIEFDQGLNTCMRHLRSTLGDNAEAPTYIETVPRRGYRFIAPIEAVAHRSHRVAPWGRLAAAAGIVGLGAWAITASSVARERPPAPLLAVLPFEPIGGTSADTAFADGLTEELLTTLAATDPARLRVLARTSSYRLAEGYTLPDLHRRFAVDLVVEGRVRREPGGYKVTAQLVDARTATARWSGEERHTTDSPQVIAQEDLSTQLATALGALIGVELSPLRAIHPGGEIATTWRVARHLAGGRTEDERRRALSLIESVLASDPAFVPAHEARARVLLDLGRTGAAQAAIEEAVATIGPSAGVLLERGRLRMRQWRLDEAGRDLAEAVKRAPHDARAHHSYGYYLGVTGRHEEASRAMGRAREIDPVSESVVGDAGLFSHWAGRPRVAIEQCEGIRPYALPEYRLMVSRCLLYNYAAVGDWPRAVEEARLVMEAAGVSASEQLEVLGATESEGSIRSYFRWAAHPAYLRFTQGGESSYRKALAAASAGDVEATLDALEAAYAEGEPRLIEIGVEPRLDPVRSGARFKAVARAVGITGEEDDTTRGES